MINTIISSIVLAISLILLKLMVYGYRWRRSAWQHEFNLKKEVDVFIKFISMGLWLLFAYGIYQMVRYGFSLPIFVTILTIPLVSLLSSSFKQSWTSLIDRYFHKRHVKNFICCPHCKESHVFYRTLPELDDLGEKAFFLITRHRQQSFLGTISSPEVQDFLKEGDIPFSTLIGRYCPSLTGDSSESISLYFPDDPKRGPHIYALDKNCYCVKCDKKVNSQSCYHGVII